MKRLFALLISAVMSAVLLAGCGDDSTVAEDTYTGVLSKVKLGMTMNKIVQLNSGCELYYDSDTEIWCVNPDTDIMEIRDIIPADNGFYYADDSLITYSFRYDKDINEHYLEGYLEEALCLIDRETAEKYYNDKSARLAAKYSAADENVKYTITGTEGVDLNLDYATTLTLSSFEVIFTMRLTYDTVDGVDGYHASYFSIEFKELQNKEAVEVSK